MRRIAIETPVIVSTAASDIIDVRVGVSKSESESETVVKTLSDGDDREKEAMLLATDLNKYGEEEIAIKFKKYVEFFNKNSIINNNYENVNITIDSSHKDVYPDNNVTDLIKNTHYNDLGNHCTKDYEKYNKIIINDIDIM